MNATDRILIAGGGPVGLLAAYALVRQGIPVTVCETLQVPERDQRAASFQPSTLELLDAFGTAEDPDRAREYLLNASLIKSLWAAAAVA
jgi:2-polyprenyl-6-methoxyphenol hydroxylase-like FAD-dependent oxidoreductase